MNTEQVINKFKIFDNSLDYSKVEYKTFHEKVIIICPEHGEFTSLIHSNPICKICRKNKRTDKMIKDFKKVHGNRYDYSKVQYKNSRTPVEIICPAHGSFFQKPTNHRLGSNCPKCAITNKYNTQEKTIKDFKKVHGNRYDYSKVDYINNTNKVEIICPEHGSFFQEPFNHKAGNGCPKCSESKGERKVREFLEENNINYSQEVKLFENYRFDFYLEDLNTIIEYDGKQHYEPVEYFGGLEGFLKTQERDRIKTEYCIKNDIRIIRIGYFEDVGEVLKCLEKN